MIRSTGTLGDEKFVGGITPQLGAAIIAKTALAAVMAEQATTETNGLVGARRAGGSRARRRSRGDPGRSRLLKRSAAPAAPAVTKMYPASYALAKAAQALPETPLADRIQNIYENITGAKNGKRSEGVEDALESNASVRTNGSPTRRDAQAAGKPANIVAKIRRWIQAPRSA